MPSINSAKRLVKATSLINLTLPQGLSLTTMLSGPHGIGKSQIISKAAKEIGGYSLVIEGGSLKEGEVTGIPFITKISEARNSFLTEYMSNMNILKEALPQINAYTESLKDINDDDMKASLKNAFAGKIVDEIFSDRKTNSEVRFTKYYIVKTLERLEKYYYEIAKTTGFLNGRIKIDGDGNLVIDKKVFKKFEEAEKIMNGDENAYSILNFLPIELKLTLLESGEIKPIFVFFDELNRTDPQVMKELMNIVLNKNVNGYNFPWFTSVVSAVNPSSQSSVYAVNELDDAQRDRFLKLKVDAKLEEWVDYALSNNMNSDVIGSIASADNIFIVREKGHTDDEEMNPSPRSWEMVNYIYTNIEKVYDSKFFNNEERKYVREDLQLLVIGKVGGTAARTFLQNIENKENNIKPIEIINGKSEKIDEKILNKFLSQKRLRQKITMENVIRHISNTVVDFEKLKKSTKPEEKKKICELQITN